MLKPVAALFAVALLAGAHTVAMADASGVAMGVDPQASAKAPAGTRTLVVGADIFIGDRVTTGASGQVQILFSDKTELVVGPKSSLLIEDYLLRNDGSAGKLAINALNGTFRFVTGSAAKDRYVIKTAAGTIGVRGTSFELWVGNGTHYLLQRHGSTINCPSGVPFPNGDGCVVVDSSCEVGFVGGGDAEVLGEMADIRGDVRNRLKAMFRYADNDRPLLRPFRITGAEDCFRTSAPGTGGSSLVKPFNFDDLDSPPRDTDSTTDGGVIQRNKP